MAADPCLYDWLHIKGHFHIGSLLVYELYDCLKSNMKCFFSVSDFKKETIVSDPNLASGNL